MNEVVCVCVVERPAIDRLLDYVWNQEARKPAIDKLIQEYLERIGSPSAHQYLTSPIVATELNNNQQIQTPGRGIQHDQLPPSFYHTPLTSGNESNGCCNTTYDFQHTASTPLLR